MCSAIIFNGDGGGYVEHTSVFVKCAAAHIPKPLCAPTAGHETSKKEENKNPVNSTSTATLSVRMDVSVCSVLVGRSVATRFTAELCIFNCLLIQG